MLFYVVAAERPLIHGRASSSGQEMDPSQPRASEHYAHFKNRVVARTVGARNGNNGFCTKSSVVYVYKDSVKMNIYHGIITPLNNLI